MTGPLAYTTSRGLSDFLAFWIDQLINADEPVGIYRDGGIYPDDVDDFCLFKGAMPPGPDKAIALTPYLVSDNGLRDDSVLGMRVLLRGGENIEDTLDAEGRIFDLMHGCDGVPASAGLFIAQTRRHTGFPPDQDSNYRTLMQSTYYSRVDYPTRFRDR